MGERHGDSMGRRLLSLSEGPEGRGEGERGGEGGGTGGFGGGAGEFGGCRSRVMVGSRLRKMRITHRNRMEGLTTEVLGGLMKR